MRIRSNSGSSSTRRKRRRRRWWWGVALTVSREWVSLLCLGPRVGLRPLLEEEGMRTKDILLFRRSLLFSYGREGDGGRKSEK